MAIFGGIQANKLLHCTARRNSARARVTPSLEEVPHLAARLSRVRRIRSRHLDARQLNLPIDDRITTKLLVQLTGRLLVS